MRLAALRWKCIFTIFSTPWHIRLLTAKEPQNYLQPNLWLADKCNVQQKTTFHFHAVRGHSTVWWAVSKNNTWGYCIAMLSNSLLFIHLYNNILHSFTLSFIYLLSYKLYPRTFLYFHAYIKIEIERTVFMNLIFSFGK